MLKLLLVLEQTPETKVHSAPRDRPIGECKGENIARFKSDGESEAGALLRHRTGCARDERVAACTLRMPVAMLPSLYLRVCNTSQTAAAIVSGRDPSRPTLIPRSPA